MPCGSICDGNPDPSRSHMISTASTQVSPPVLITLLSFRNAVVQSATTKRQSRIPGGPRRLRLRSSSKGRRNRCARDREQGGSDGGQPREGPLLAARGLGKRYAHHPVLRDVDFAVQAGESVAVIGENGAGKSTFVKILAGVIQPDDGEILLRGAPVVFPSPREAIKAGVAFIPQELAYVPDLTVAENIVIGQWPSTSGLTSPRAIQARAEEEVRRFGLEVDVRRRMGTLKLADRQLVEILKALSRRAQRHPPRRTDRLIDRRREPRPLPGAARSLPERRRRGLHLPPHGRGVSLQRSRRRAAKRRAGGFDAFRSGDTGATDRRHARTGGGDIRGSSR